MKETFFALGMLIACCAVITKCTGCSPAELPEVAAASGYEAQQMACVDQYAEKASIDACRARVKAAWANDAGKDGAK